MKASDLRKLPVHAVVQVTWLDISENPTGDPRASELAERNTLGWIWDVKRDKERKIDVLTLTFTRDHDGPEQAGWICIPSSVITAVEVIRAPGKKHGME